MKKCNVCGAENFDCFSHCEKCKSPFVSSISPLNSFSFSDPNLDAAERSNAGQEIFRRLEVATKVFLIIKFVVSTIIAASCLIYWLIALANKDILFPYVLIVACVCWILSIIALVIDLFVVKHYYDCVASNEKISMAYKIFVLLCIDVVSGTLMLVDNR